MKNFISMPCLNSSFVVLALTLISTATFAAEVRGFGAPSDSSKIQVREMGAGVAFMTDNIVRSSTAATLYLGLNSDNYIQTYLGLPTTSPFNFGLGGIYKHTVVRRGEASFHIGGGLGFGTAQKSGDNKFFFNLNGVGGIDFHFHDFDQVLFTVDAGPTLQIWSGDANFSIAAVTIGITYIF